MDTSGTKQIIISFDGLNRTQFELMRNQLPALNELLLKGKTAKLHSDPFVDVQPIWAEALTAKPWHENGCTGFAQPTKTLNDMRVFSENDLLAPIAFESQSRPDGTCGAQSSKSIWINVPLVRPNDSHRIWLGDGGLPISQYVSPTALMKSSESLRRYDPRPYVSMGAAMADWMTAINVYVDIESTRVDCLKELSQKQNWNFLCYRISLFDQLLHLLDDDFVSRPRSIAKTKLNDFLAHLDHALVEVFRQSDKAIIFSGFSHVQCRGVFSINDALEQARLLARTTKQANEMSLRIHALAATGRDKEALTKPVSLTESLNYVPKRTLCASPVKSAIFLNTKPRFEDGGTVDDETRERELDRIEAFLKMATSKYFANAKIVRNPNAKSKAPEFLFQARGIELVESLPVIFKDQDIPLTTHLSEGFVWSRKVDNENSIFRPVDLRQLV